MRTIINNTDLYTAMKDGDAWSAFCDWNENQVHQILLLGGLDHITISAKQIKLHDIGMNGKVMDVIVRPDRPAEHPAPLTYTTYQVASMFHVTTKTIYNWVEEGKLHPLRSSKTSGSKLLFPVAEVDAMFHPQRFDLRSAFSKNLASALVNTAVKLSNGQIDTIMGIELAPNSVVEVLTSAHGWFSLSGRSVSSRDLYIVDYYVDPKMI